MTSRRRVEALLAEILPARVPMRQSWTQPNAEARTRHRLPRTEGLFRQLAVDLSSALRRSVQSGNRRAVRLGVLRIASASRRRQESPRQPDFERYARNGSPRLRKRRVQSPKTRTRGALRLRTQRRSIPDGRRAHARPGGRTRPRALRGLDAGRRPRPGGRRRRFGRSGSTRAASSPSRSPTTSCARPMSW